MIKRILAFICSIAVLMTGMTLTGFAVEEDRTEVSATPQLYIDDTLIELKNPCVVEGEAVYLPLIETFFKMGVYISWNDRYNCWYGEGNNGEIRITMDSMTADIDWVDVELPYPTKEINRVPMVPLYLIEDALKTDPGVYDSERNRIDLEFPPLSGTPEPKFSIAAIEYQLPKVDDFFKPEWLENMQDDKGTSYIKYDMVDVEGMPFKKAARLETLPYEDGRIPSAIYDIQKHVYVDNETFEAGDVGLMTFWARATKITDESGVAKFKPTYETLGTWRKANDATVSVGPEWKKYYLPLYSGLNTLPAGNSHICFAVGAKPQVVEIADMHFYNYKKEVSPETLIPDKGKAYKGIEDDALWRKEAYRRIEKYRNNDMVVYVKDENGNPIEGAKVNADMAATDNEFLYGYATMHNETQNLDEEHSKTDRLRADVLEKMGNACVEGFDLKSNWDDYVRGIRSVNAIYDRNLEQRGHALTWDTSIKFDTWQSFNGLDSKTYDEIYEFLDTEVKKELWLFKGIFKQWDVLNEPFDSNKIRTRYGTQIFSDMFKTAKALDPTAKLFVNETGMEGHPDREHSMRATGLVNNIVKPMIENERAPIDGLGVQGHCTNYYYPQGFYQELKVLGSIVDDLAVTEYDFYNEDYTYAPQHLRDTFLATYSHPKTSAFIIWGYFDPMHWRRYGPFYDESWNAKPEFYEWQRIMKDELADHDSAVTDENGRAVLRGMRGKYTVSVDTGSAEGETRFTLTNAQNAERDNRIDAVVNGSYVSMTHSNPTEFYSNGPVKYKNGTEAYASYLEYVGNRTLIGIYKHHDNNGNTVPKTTDGLQDTYWYAENPGDYVEYELVEKADKGDVSVSFRTPNNEEYKYKILSSADGESWTELYTGSSKQPKTVEFKDAMFIRIQSVDNDYMGISEVTINAEK